MKKTCFVFDVAVFQFDAFYNIKTVGQQMFPVDLRFEHMTSVGICKYYITINSSVHL